MEVKLKEETELWEPRGPCGSRGPAEEPRGPCGSRGPAEEPRGPCGSWGPAEEHTHSEAVEPEPELSVKQEPQELHRVTVKTEDDEDKSSVLHQSEENREETNVWDCGAEAGCSSDPLTQFHSDSEEHTDSSEDTDHSEDYSQQQAPAKRSYAMVRPCSCSECGQTFLWRAELQRHLVVHSDERPLKCSVCVKTFKFKFSLTRHQKLCHDVCRQRKSRSKGETAVKRQSTRSDSGPCSCSVCGRSFRWSSELKRHMTSHSDERPHRCSVCGKDFKDHFRLKVHTRSHTGDKPYVCSVCDKGFTKTLGLSRHQKQVHHMCPVCKACSPNWVTLNEHLKAHVEDGSVDRAFLEPENMTPFRCSLCGKEFERKSHLERHMNFHTEQRRHRCPVCEKPFQHKTRLREHVRTHTGEKPYVCAVCGNAFAAFSSLSKHQKLVHHMCPLCKESFSDRIKLNEHLQTHVEDGTLEQSVFERKYTERYQCSVCEKEFKQELYLRRHTITHTEEKPFRCSLCDKGFTHRYEMNRHLKFVHRTCPLCEEEFVRDSDLSEHLQTHVEDPLLLKRVIGKQYDCSVCGKEFKRKWALQTHELVHSGEKPFKCSVCQKTFGQKSTLNTHLKTHSGERPFVCSVCDKGFITSSNLKKHMKNHEKNVS